MFISTALATGVSEFDEALSWQRWSAAREMGY